MPTANALFGTKQLSRTVQVQEVLGKHFNDNPLTRPAKTSSNAFELPDPRDGHPHLCIDGTLRDTTNLLERIVMYDLRSEISGMSGLGAGEAPEILRSQRPGTVAENFEVIPFPQASPSRKRTSFHWQSQHCEPV